VVLQRAAKMLVIAYERPASYYAKVLEGMGADPQDHLFLHIGEAEEGRNERGLHVDSPKNLTELKIAISELIRRAKKEGRGEWVFVGASINSLALFHEYKLLGQFSSDLGRELRRAGIYRIVLMNPDPALERVLRPGFDDTLFVQGSPEGRLASALGAEVSM
jgi:hypothetical protein